MRGHKGIAEGFCGLAESLPFCNGAPVKNSAYSLKRSKGQTLVEYALILAFVSVVAIAVLIRLGSSVRGVYSTITSQIAVASSSH